MTEDMFGLGGRKLVLLGCGKMGGAMLSGWLARGLPGAQVQVVDPGAGAHHAGFMEAGVAFNPATLDPDAAVVLLAVKPQMMETALPQVAKMTSAAFLSIAAGKTIAWFEARLPAGAAVIRAMPNTPAAVGRGIAALCANAKATDSQRRSAETLLRAVGDAVWVEDEALMDAVTAISGSGPAYVFHMIEAMTAAGEALGLPPETAARLARATVSGAGALADQSSESAAQLRINVTSPGGTTAAALAVLADTGALSELMTKAATAAAARGRELAG